MQSRPVRWRGAVAGAPIEITAAAMPHAGLPRLPFHRHHRTGCRRLSGARPPAHGIGRPACHDWLGLIGAVSTRPSAGSIRLFLRSDARHRPKRPAGHLPDRHLHRSRGDPARADVTGMTHCLYARAPLCCCCTNGRSSSSAGDWPRRDLYDQRPPDRDRLAGHAQGFAVALSLFLLLRAPDLSFTVHGRDAVGASSLRSS